GVAPPTRSLVTTRTRRPRAAAVSATEIPAAPDPMTTTSASRCQAGVSEHAAASAEPAEPVEPAEPADPAAPAAPAKPVTARLPAQRPGRWRSSPRPR